MTDHARATSTASVGRRTARGRAFFGALCAAALGLAASLGTGTPAAGAAEACPNEAIRVQEGATYLPDCRAYEQVSPVDKNGYNAIIYQSQGTADGDAFSYWNIQPGSFPGSAASTVTNIYNAVRSESGWTTDPVWPATTLASPSTGDGGVPVWLGNSTDFGRGLLETAESFDPGDTFAGQGTHDFDVYRRNPDGSLTWMTRGPRTSLEQGRHLAGATPDLSHIVFNSTNSLDPAHPVADGGGHDQYNPPGGRTSIYQGYLYESDGGAPKNVGVLPDGSVSPGGAILGNVGGGLGLAKGAISPDGNGVIFQSVDPAAGITTVPQLYLYMNGEQTRLISKGPAPANTPADRQIVYDGAVWHGDDAGTVFFSTASDLLGGHPDGGLYSYDIASGEVTYLVPAVHGYVGLSQDCVNASPNACSGVLDISDDGSRVYFTSSVSLAPGQSEAGQTNVYVYDTTSHSIAFIAKFDGTQGSLGTPTVNEGGSTTSWGTAQYEFGTHGSSYTELTPDGRWFVFTANAELTGVPNNGFAEVYRYDAVADTLICVSCGAGPVTADSLTLLPGTGPAGGLQISHGMGNILGPNRYVSDDGSYIFFNTRQGLDPRDTNELNDPYVWHDGKISLLTSGTSSDPAFFSTAGASGRDAIIDSAERFVGQDVDSLYDIYDVRIDGGLAGQNPPAPAGCSGDGCQGPSEAAPAATAPASGAFRGAGNVHPRANCGKASAKAKRLSRRARRARRRAGRATSRVRAHRFRSDARRLARRAGQQSQRGKSCRGNQHQGKRHDGKLHRRATQHRVKPATHRNG